MRPLLWSLWLATSVLALPHDVNNSPSHHKSLQPRAEPLTPEEIEALIPDAKDHLRGHHQIYWTLSNQDARELIQCIHKGGGKIGTNYRYSWETWFSCLNALKTRRWAYVKSLLDMPLAAQDGPSSRKSSGAQYRTAEQVDRDAVLLAGRSHLQGKRDIDWDVTDAEVRDWVKCIYDHGGIIDLEFYKLPWDGLFQCTDALKARHLAQSAESSTASQKKPAQKKTSKKKGNTNAFSLLRSGPGGFGTLRDQTKHRFADTAAGVEQRLSSLGRHLTPDGQLWTSAAALARSASTVKRPTFVPAGP